MKDKNLILKEEVTRILEMMKIDSKKSQVLNESIIDDIISASVRYGVKSTDDVAVKITKLEKEFGLPKGTLKDVDILNLAKGGKPAQDVVIKIITNLKGSNLTNFAKKVWGQLGGDVHKNAMDIIDGLKTSGKKYTYNEVMDYLNNMSETLIKSDNQINNLVVALRKEFVDRSYDSLKGSGVVDDVLGSSSKSKFVTKPSPTTTTISSPGKYVKGTDPEFDTVFDQGLTEAPYKLSDDQTDELRQFVYTTMYKGKTSIDVNDFLQQVKTRVESIKSGITGKQAQKLSRIQKITQKLKESCGIGKIDWKTFYKAPGCAVGFIGIATALSAFGDFIGVDNSLWKKTACSLLSFADIPDFWTISDSNFYRDLCSGQEWWKSGEKSDDEVSIGDVTIDEFNEFIKNDWGEEYTGNETFRKEGDIFIVNDGDEDFKYEYKNGTFKWNKEL